MEVHTLWRRIKRWNTHGGGASWHARLEQLGIKLPSPTAPIANHVPYWETMNGIYVAYFTREPKPVRATVESGLLPPYPFEIQAIADVDE